MIRSTVAKASESIKESKAVVSNVVPRYQTPKTWLSGVRAILAFYAPLLLGLALGNPLATLPISIGALLISFVDPLGSNAKRLAVLGASTVGCTLSFGIGQYAGLHPVASVLFAIVLVFIGSLSGAMGSAAMRGGFWMISAGLYGIATAGVNPGYFTVTGMLFGGAWAIFLSLVPFSNHSGPIVKSLHPSTLSVHGVGRHTKQFIRELPGHFTMKTAIGRSSARLAATAGLGICLSLILDRHSSIWIAAAAIAVLNPQVSLFRERGARLVLATALGAAAAVLLILLAPSISVLLIIVIPLLFFAANLRNENYAMWVMLYSAFALALMFMSGAGGPAGATSLESLTHSFDAKFLDTLMGVSLALIVAKISFTPVEKEQLDLELTQARLNVNASLVQAELEREAAAEKVRQRKGSPVASTAATPAANATSKNAGSSS